MKNHELKRAKRRFVSRLKKKLANTIRNESGDAESLNKNKLQVLKKRRFKIIKDKEHQENAERRERISAPVFIDYYNEVNLHKTNLFLAKLRKNIIEKKKNISINFDHTKQITASAMISFLAEVDTLIARSSRGKSCITFTHPKVEKVESVLKQIGFYDLLKKPVRETKKFDDVAYWNYASGARSDTQQASEAMKEIELNISQRAQKKLYKGFIEAMANCVEHAYYGKEIDDDSTTKWWAFAGIKESVLVVVICDKGIGIPNSLPLTRKDEFIESIRNMLQLKKLNDSAMIKIASQMGRTRTKQGHRGKGLKDIRAIIDTLNEGNLSIYSNKGYYRYYRNNMKLFDNRKEHKTSVCGTIVEWAIPLTADARED
ncbi:ATP-binding protein [Cronobacter sakazakii]|uniref:ATP-binding protein n=1 Tax=Cronobacter TaxID=413496 RepID=UPI001C0C3F2A|nr:ATP-binding protein [Cronobacter sakazakii]EIV2971720.1 ATP-binding protein [Cronobacter sakazakii]EKY1998860.1 ATP-binding protein [Cronobacter sakazakii]ELQ6167622.1 ATP-binding protein [Cronobacter sakazakii]ELY3536912.1 ATP-binding protein [Cronobacter sakazakii]ELY3593840.1 ATP-binding protein [Cronobacter sakazakii]